MWNQVYDPLNSKALSTIVAALPVVTLLVLIASNKVKAHWAAIIALIVANLVAIFVFTCLQACRCVRPCSAQLPASFPLVGLS
jgi:L-lactate permease